jgi:hypothetical protein
MSRRRRSRTQSQSSPPLSVISSPADPPSQPDALADVVIEYATTFEQAIVIHRFLLVELSAEIEKRGGEIDAEKSLIEIIRVCKDEAAIIALKNGCLIGTMGIIRWTWWFNNVDFLTDRWTAILPEFQHEGVHELLLAEVKTIANSAGLKFVNQGKIRDMKDGTSMMFPRIYTPPQELHDTPTLGSA